MLRRKVKVEPLTTYKIHDDRMPGDWHTIKSVLLAEIATAANFHLCALGASALFHARLIGESIARETYGLNLDNSSPGEMRQPTDEAPDAAT